MTELPKGWAKASLAEICQINPLVDKKAFEPDDVVAFVPMPAVEAKTGRIDVFETRTFNEVKQGYTPFMKGDVLFAKITPCMENGKMAIVPEMVSKHGFGSTEFHVLRPLDGIASEYVYHAVSNLGFRYHAEHNMTGAVGQKRVPTSVLEDHAIGVPPANEQRRIVERIEAMFDEIDHGVQSLKKARETLGLYRQSLLKSAFEGHLTADWRARNADKLETPEALLARIQAERDARYKSALDDWQKALTDWRDNGEEGKKPSKPKRPSDVTELDETELSSAPSVPADWGMGRLGLYLEWIEAGKSFKCLETPPEGDQVGVAKVSAVSWGEYDEAESKTCLDADMVNEDWLIRSGDFLLSRANTIELVGASVIAKNVTKKVMLSDKTLRLHFDSGDRRFILHYLRSPFGRGEIEQRSTGNQESMRNIGQDRIKNIMLPICSPDEQAEITRIVDERLSAADALEAEIDVGLIRAEALRQSILKQAFSGKLVPQDPEDEPAADLLARIKAETATKPKAPRKRKASA